MSNFMEIMWKNPPTTISSIASVSDKKIKKKVISNFGRFTTVFDIKCTCKHEYFKIIGKELDSDYKGLSGTIKVECDNCKKTFLIFDPLKHGYNGEIGEGIDHSDYKDKILSCVYCNFEYFKPSFGFQYSGDEIELIRENHLDIKPQNLFGWFLGFGVCNSCGQINEIISYECQ